MSVADLRAELEADRAWREDEIRFFQNRGAGLRTERKQDQYRRALVLLLYAHFEGFCKFALTLYVNAINSEDIPCADASHAIAAASLADVFMALRDANSKCDEFRNAAPDDTQLHRFARDREFVRRATELLQRKVVIPQEIVETESNLKPVVLRKNLFRLGFPHDLFLQFEGNMNQLLAYRNRIAHGDSGVGVNASAYESLRNSVSLIMDEITVQVTAAIAERRYLR